MNRFNERPGMLVQSTPPNAKQQDQNKAAVGPTRVNVEEQVKQVLDAKPTIDFTLPQTGVNFGAFAAGYWYCSDHLGSVHNGAPTGNTWADSSGVTYPMTVGESSVIDAFGITVTDNTAAPSTSPPPGGDYYIARVGLYSDVDGFPGDLVAVSNSFCYGDGSMTTNVLTVLSLATPTVVVAGKYWLMLRKTGTFQLPNPAYLRGRNTEQSARIPLTEANINTIGGTSAFTYASFGINFPSAVGGDPALPTTFDPTAYTLTPRNAYVPEIWLRGA